MSTSRPRRRRDLHRRKTATDSEDLLTEFPRPRRGAAATFIRGRPPRTRKTSTRNIDVLAAAPPRPSSEEDLRGRTRRRYASEATRALVYTLLAVSIATLLFVATMMYNQVYAIVTGIGTIDRMRKRGPKGNFAPVPWVDVFGVDPWPMYLLPTDVKSAAEPKSSQTTEIFSNDPSSVSNVSNDPSQRPVSAEYPRRRRGGAETPRRRRGGAATPRPVSTDRIPTSSRRRRRDLSLRTPTSPRRRRRDLSLRTPTSYVLPGTATSTASWATKSRRGRSRRGPSRRRRTRRRARRRRRPPRRRRQRRAPRRRRRRRHRPGARRTIRRQWSKITY